MLPGLEAYSCPVLACWRARAAARLLPCSPKAVVSFSTTMQGTGTLNTQYRLQNSPVVSIVAVAAPICVNQGIDFFPVGLDHFGDDFQTLGRHLI